MSALDERHRAAWEERERLRRHDGRYRRTGLGMCDRCGRDDYKCRCAPAAEPSKESDR